ncbi:5-methylcytosine-specific restriction endonuclease McrA [Sinorhizobium fredii]
MRNKRANDDEFREKLNAYQREYNSKPERKQKRKEKDAERYLKQKESNQEGKEDRREYQRNYMRERLASDPKFKLNLSFSSAIRKSLLSGKGGRKWVSLVDYTIDELRAHLERQFLPGMSWENYGEWHIDHIVPLAAHNYETPEDIDFKRAWALSNLQPLWGADNIRKGAKLDKPFQPSLLLRPTNDNTAQPTTAAA